MSNRERDLYEGLAHGGPYKGKIISHRYPIMNVARRLHAMPSVRSFAESLNIVYGKYEYVDDEIWVWMGWEDEKPSP